LVPYCSAFIVHETLSSFLHILICFEVTCFRLTAVFDMLSQINFEVFPGPYFRGERGNFSKVDFQPSPHAELV